MFGAHKAFCSQRLGFVLRGIGCPTRTFGAKEDCMQTEDRHLYERLMAGDPALQRDFLRVLQAFCPLGASRLCRSVGYPLCLCQ